MALLRTIIPVIVDDDNEDDDDDFVRPRAKRPKPRGRVVIADDDDDGDDEDEGDNDGGASDDTSGSGDGMDCHMPLVRIPHSDKTPACAAAVVDDDSDDDDFCKSPISRRGQSAVHDRAKSCPASASSAARVGDVPVSGVGSTQISISKVLTPRSSRREKDNARLKKWRLKQKAAKQETAETKRDVTDADDTGNGGIDAVGKGSRGAIVLSDSDSENDASEKPFRPHGMCQCSLVCQYFYLTSGDSITTVAANIFVCAVQPNRACFCLSPTRRHMLHCWLSCSDTCLLLLLQTSYL